MDFSNKIKIIFPAFPALTQNSASSRIFVKFRRLEMSKEFKGEAPSNYKILLGLTPKEVKKTTFDRGDTVKLTKSKTEQQKSSKC